MLYVDHVPKLMSSLPYSLARFMTQGGEHANYRDNNYFYNHTTRHGGQKSVLQDPAYATLFHRFKTLCHDIDQYRNSDDPNLKNTVDKFSNFLQTDKNVEEVITTSPLHKSVKRLPDVEQMISKIFSGMYFILVGSIQQAKLRHSITDNGGFVVVDLVQSLIHPILIKKGQTQMISDYSLNLKNVFNLVRSRDLLLKDKHFSSRCSMLTLLKRSRQKAHLCPTLTQCKKQKVYKNPATYYAMTRRKYFGHNVKTFEETRVLNKLLMAEWKRLTPRSKKKSTIDWTQHVKDRPKKKTKASHGSLNVCTTSRRLPF